MNIESKIAHMLFFASVKNGFFDYNTSIKFSLIKFNENKSIELSPSLLEYLCYKIVKNHFLHENFINTDIVLITEKVLSLVNDQNIFKLTNKKYIIILIQDEQKQKWNLIMFPNLQEQINNCFNSKNKKKIVVYIISSNLYEEDEYETESNVDILSLNKYINNYINKEREVSINNINSVFEQVTDTINQKLGNNSTERENIKTTIIDTKNEFDGMCEETLNHFDEVKNQKNEIEYKINSQMEEQFGKVNDILSNEVEIEEKNRNDIINASQIYLADLGKKMKNEKIER